MRRFLLKTTVLFCLAFGVLLPVNDSLAWGKYGDGLCACFQEDTCQTFMSNEKGAPIFPSESSCRTYCEKTKNLEKLTNVEIASDEQAALVLREKCTKATPVAPGAQEETDWSQIYTGAGATAPYTKPALNVPIPGVDFTSPVRKGDFLTTDFILTYLNGLYKYLLGAAVLIAILMLTIGGLQYVLGAGSASQIEKGKERIKNATVGLVLLFGTVTILFTVNPQLVALKNLNLLSIKTQPSDFITLDKGIEPEGQRRAKNDPTFDETFKAFANCEPGVDWRVLKGVAFKESAFNHTTVNGFGFTGLFQTKTPNCQTYLRNDPAWRSMCGDLKSPYVSTAVGIRSIQAGLRIVERRCPNVNNDIKGRLVYWAHNSGNGALQKIISEGACNSEEATDTAIYRYWESKGKSAAFNNRRVKSARDTSIFISQYGVTDFRDTSQNGSAACPLDSDPSNFSFTQPTTATGDIKCPSQSSSILGVGDSITNNTRSYANQIKDTCSTASVTKIARDSQQTAWMNQQLTTSNLAGKEYLVILGGVNDISSGKSLQHIQTQLTEIYQKANNAGVKVVAVTVSPWKGWSTWSESNHQKTIQLNNWIRSQEGGNVYKVIDFYNIAKDPSDPQKLYGPYDGGDHLHPNATGHAALAAEISKQLY